MTKREWLFAGIIAVTVASALRAAGEPPPSGGKSAVPQPLMTYLADELAYSMENLATEDGSKPYYLNYTVYEEHTATISASLGAITDSEA